MQNRSSEEEYDQNDDRSYLLRRFIHDYLRPNLKTYLPIQSLHVLGALVGLIPPLLLRQMIDTAIPSGNISEVITLSLYALGTFTGISLIRFLRNYFGHRIAQRIVFDMRNDLYNHFQQLPMRFHDNRKTGELMSRVIDDLNLMQEFIHHGPEGVLEAGTTILGVLVILFTLNVPLTLIALSFTPFLAIFATVLIERMHKAFRRNRQAKARLNDRLEDNLSGMKVIKSFANENYEQERFIDRNEEHYHARAAAIKYFSTLGPVSFFLNSIGLVLTLGYGGYLVAAGHLTAGTVVAFYTYLMRFRAPILRLVRIGERLSRFFASTERFFSHIDLKPDIALTPGSFRKDPGEFEGEITFDKVDFTYQGGEQVLKDLSFSVNPRETVALVGPSGAGKTTIAQLIPRFYDVDRGKVTVEGVNVKDWDLKSLRNNVSMVMQDDFLFSGTIRENIAYGDPDSPMEEILHFAREANVDTFANELPDSYDTEVGQRGVKLSGGQRQRISIARALLQDPGILILDEATSSVDSYTEQLIQEAIDRVSEGRTTIIIAHRLSTVVNSDQILFIEEGRIKEQGTYRQLMEEEGKFFEFHKLQFKPSEV
ncbi:MAG: ABC transporter ATP-binding protein [Candidatus Acetothermia bacterium]